ncbi:hypothetical protein, partial [Escherichia coli]|uniref:hypothetical protein n=1 Tax=Escherichia coli TaxID=562 RepID=UPI0020257C5B
MKQAKVEIDGGGTPGSGGCDDVYFCNENGLEEKRYVFLGGNQLGVRFPEHPHPLF